VPFKQNKKQTKNQIQPHFKKSWDIKDCKVKESREISVRLEQGRKPLLNVRDL